MSRAANLLPPIPLPILLPIPLPILLLPVLLPPVLLVSGCKPATQDAAVSSVDAALCGDPARRTFADEDHRRSMASSCDRRGIDLAQGTAAEPPNPALAVAYFEKSCDFDHPEGCHNLGHMYSEGDGVDADRARAAEAWEKACDLGNAPSCAAAGDVHHDAGEHTRANPLWRRGCDGGVPDACYDLATSLRLGRGIDRDAPGAMRILEPICPEYPRACCTLGEYHWQGTDGVPQDDARALAFFEQGCPAGGLLSCVRLGDAHAEGRGRPRDLARAREYWTQGCVPGTLDLGCERLEQHPQ